ncbi:hypothetical protein GK047_27630 [Paenibacillus sp. SYP-B3998]|uniref:AlgX/AlgJ SGNH hydrolase-like domain-containing protein n=1 Tax=Paenibacillus sp. SYP-B3998 TaxID=2678564 RepID=A0A6G4A5G0_9BACL|nr:DHHW family protein [Paenibacillus sp. SYP-B3998]NEW09703.1 hypothetical protein [Paenibacillus sp. SYP-B3998]
MKRYDKLNKYLMAIVLLLFIALILVLNLFNPNKIFSDSENRNLEQLPKFSFQSLVSGKFTSNYEKYISDQFMARNLWIGVKSDADRVLGKKESNGVYLGKDGFLIQKFSPPAAEDLKEKAGAINSFDIATPTLRKFVMLVPTAASVLDNKLPDYVADSDELMYIDKVKQSLRGDIRFLNLYPALSSKKEEYIFYQTDHHWTTRGAYYGYRALSEQMGFTPKDEAYFNITKVTDEFYGSLYSKSGFRHLNPDSIELFTPKEKVAYKVEYVDENQSTDSLYEMDNIRKKDKYTVFLDGNYPLVKITTGNPEGRKLLVVKDSYANCFIPFLAPHFSEIYVVDLRYYEKNLNTLLFDNQINDMLLLYNVNTFFEDPSIKNISEGIE